MNKLRKQFGENLKRRRMEAGMTQERLADLAKLDRTAIGLLERGKRTPRLDTILTLARALDLGSPADLLVGLY